MSQVETALLRLRAFALQTSIAKLASEAGVDHDTARRLLKQNPRQVDNLIKLEKAMDRLSAPAESAT